MTKEQRKAVREFWKQRETRDNRKGKDRMNVARKRVRRFMTKQLNSRKDMFKEREYKKDQESDSSS